MGDFDGKALPLSYLLLETGNSKVDHGKRGIPLTHWFKQLKQRGLCPKFMFSDKDTAQIKASKLAWPDTKIQLCLWHLKKAIVDRLKKREHGEKIAENTHNRNLLCSNSISLEWTNSGASGTFCKKELHTEIIEIVERHFHYHPSIPIHRNGSNITLTSEQIRGSCLQELYAFCRHQNLPQVFRYFWINWYCPDRWEWWALSSLSENIPLARTTMVLESHWKVLKRDHLYKYVQPRLDFLAYIVVTRFLPSQVTRHRQLIEQRIYSSWKEQFVKEFRTLVAKPINGSYLTNVDRWTCSCPSFFRHRYHLCKHLASLALFRLHSDKNDQPSPSQASNSSLCCNNYRSHLPHASHISRNRSPPFVQIAKVNAASSKPAIYKPPRSQLPSPSIVHVDTDTPDIPRQLEQHLDNFDDYQPTLFDDRVEPELGEDEAASMIQSMEERDSQLACLQALTNHLMSQRGNESSLGNEKHVDRVLGWKGLGALVTNIWKDIKVMQGKRVQVSLQEAQKSVALYLHGKDETTSKEGRCNRPKNEHCAVDGVRLPDTIPRSPIPAVITEEPDARITTVTHPRSIDQTATCMPSAQQKRALKKVFNRDDRSPKRSKRWENQKLSDSMALINAGRVNLHRLQPRTWLNDEVYLYINECHLR